MPARSNRFQHLVAVIQGQLAPKNAMVSEAKLLTDPVTGQKREADVFIELPTGLSVANVVVEIRDHGRKQGIEWLDSVASKWRTFGYSVFLVSSSGFSNSASKHAEKLGVTLLTWNEAEDADWQALALQGRSLRVSLRIPTLTHVDADILEKLSVVDRAAIQSLDARMLGVKKQDIGSVSDICLEIINSDGVLDRFNTGLNRKKTTFKVGAVTNDLFLQGSENAYTVRALMMTVDVDFADSTVEMRPFTLGSAKGAWGDAMLGPSTIMAIAAVSEDAGPMLSFSFQDGPEIKAVKWTPDDGDSWS